MTELEEIIERIRKLTDSDRRRLLSLLAGQDRHNGGDLHAFLAERRFSCGLCYPKCGSAGVKRNGHKDGIQRYRCTECARTFSSARTRYWRPRRKSCPYGRPSSGA